ncbi:hypothetical protein HDV00_004273 [Rhizophlyctis rosea]|nr:hypothetical protein HDV00_004273 [Rhizophlyctis rosea]
MGKKNLPETKRQGREKKQKKQKLEEEKIRRLHLQTKAESLCWDYLDVHTAKERKISYNGIDQADRDEVKQFVAESDMYKAEKQVKIKEHVAHLYTMAGEAAFEY